MAVENFAGLAAFIRNSYAGRLVDVLDVRVAYISQFTFLVGVAASAVMVVLPYYLHNVKVFGRITILGEFLAVASVTMCMLFIIVDLGKLMRLMNVILYPTPNSILFWDIFGSNPIG